MKRLKTKQARTSALEYLDHMTLLSSIGHCTQPDCVNIADLVDLLFRMDSEVMITEQADVHSAPTVRQWLKGGL